MTYQELVDECKRLRLISERNEAGFFAFLMQADREHADVWKGAGCETFEQFLNSNHLCEFARYHFFSIGVDRVGVDMALKNGTHWTIQAGKMQTPSKAALKAFSDRAVAFLDVEKVAPSEQATRQWAAEINANGREPRKIDQVNELHRLRAENASLKADLRAAQDTIEDLRQRLRAAKQIADARTRTKGGKSQHDRA